MLMCFAERFGFGVFSVAIDWRVGAALNELWPSYIDLSIIHFASNESMSGEVHEDVLLEKL